MGIEITGARQAADCADVWRRRGRRGREVGAGRWDRILSEEGLEGRATWQACESESVCGWAEEGHGVPEVSRMRRSEEAYQRRELLAIGAMCGGISLHHFGCRESRVEVADQKATSPRPPRARARALAGLVTSEPRCAPLASGREARLGLGARLLGPHPDFMQCVSRESAPPRTVRSCSSRRQPRFER